jgi:hypothetical protein
MALTLETEDYNALRKAIDESRNATNLPDETIELSIYKDRAEAWIASRTSDEGVHAKNALIFYCASLIAPTCNITRTENFGTPGGYSRDVESPSQRAARLLGWAENELDLLSGDDEGHSPNLVRSVILQGGSWF